MSKKVQYKSIVTNVLQFTQNTSILTGVYVPGKKKKQEFLTFF